MDGDLSFHRGRQARVGGRATRDAAPLCAARRPRAAQSPFRLRTRAMRRLHRACEWRGDALLRVADVGGGGQDGDDHRRTRHAREVASAAGRLRCRRRAAVRLLHQRLGDDRRRGAEEEAESERRRAARCARGTEMPVRHACRDPARDQARPDPARVGGAMDRREFLKTSGALVVSFSLPPIEALAQGAGKPALVPTELDSWIAILPDGRVSAFFGKMDMGQGLDIAVAQIVAEELDVGFDKVEVLMGDTATSCNQGGASGSTGVSNGVRLLRRAAAEARRVLVESASQKLGVPAAELQVENGAVFSKSEKSKNISYADLIGGRHFHHQVEWNRQTGNPMDIKVQAQPKAPSAYKVVGKPLPRRDIAWKVYGTGDFVTDVRVPGMLHARVIRPPRPACKLRSVDEGSIKAIRGARVVREKDFVAVVAPREWDAVRAAQLLKVDWHMLEGVFPDMDKLYDHIRAARVVKRQEEVTRGDVAAALKAPGVRLVEAEY